MTIKHKIFLPEVGFTKTGLAVVLKIVDLYIQKEISVDFDIHILLSTKEEIGQQGLLNASKSFDVQNLRYALCIDRKSNRNAEQKRHIVDEYCSIPLLENDDLLHLLNRVTPFLFLLIGKFHNCADALELRIESISKCFDHNQKNRTCCIKNMLTNITNS